MCDPPYLSKQQMLDWARAEGLRPPRLYEQGFKHNNCHGVCVRAGQRQWVHLLEVAPERYAAAEAQENKLRTILGDVAILSSQPPNRDVTTRSALFRRLPVPQARHRGRTPPAGPTCRRGCGLVRQRAPPANNHQEGDHRAHQ
jgi:hypothetical protein